MKKMENKYIKYIIMVILMFNFFSALYMVYMYNLTTYTFYLYTLIISFVLFASILMTYLHVLSMQNVNDNFAGLIEALEGSQEDWETKVRNVMPKVEKTIIKELGK